MSTLTLVFTFLATFQASQQASVWPQPQAILESKHFYVVDPNEFEFNTSHAPPCDILEYAIRAFKSTAFVQDCSHLDSSFIGDYFHPQTIDVQSDPNYAGQIKEVSIRYKGQCEMYPYMDMNEYYTIDIDSSGAVITGQSIWAVNLAIETLSQLLENVGRDQFKLPLLSIVDYPRFKHRGLMLDTSRHYLPMRSLLQTLDAMHYNKFNVFHWHIVDDQSFPFVSETFPELSARGAFNPRTHVYTKKDVDNVIGYARLKGIRVLVEFDSPGHTEAWGKGQNNLLTPCYDQGKANGRFGPIDPINNDSYVFMDKLLSEVSRRFPDQYIHLGGDEVDFSCWQSNPDVLDFMKQMKFGTDFAKLESFYIQKILDIVHSLDKSYLVWQEVLDNQVKLKPDTVVHVWKGDDWQDEMKKSTSQGFTTLLSACWYLNYIRYGSDWHDYYNCEPYNFNATQTEESLVIGGEACMWGEWVDASNVISRTWPRASAVAERLWSAQHVNSSSAASARFNRQHCRMQKLGLRAEPANGPGHCECDYAL